MTCAPTATRTRDLPLRRRSLYPLSYRGLSGPLAYLGWRAAVVRCLAEGCPHLSISSVGANRANRTRKWSEVMGRWPTRPKLMGSRRERLVGRSVLVLGG